MFWETSHLNFFLLFHRHKSCSYLILGQIIIFLIPSGYKLIIHNPIQRKSSRVWAGPISPLKRLFVWLSYYSASGWYYNSYTLETPNCSSSRISLGTPGPVIPETLPLLKCWARHWAGLSEWRSKEWHIRQIPANAELQGKQISSRKSDREAWRNHYTVPCFLQLKCFSWEFRYAEYLQLELGRVWIL